MTTTTIDRPVSDETLAKFRSWLAAETDSLSAHLTEVEGLLAECVATGRPAGDILFVTQHRDLALGWWENHLGLCREFAAFARRTIAV